MITYAQYRAVSPPLRTATPTLPVIVTRKR